MSQIPTLTFDTDNLPPADRLRAWLSAIPQYDARIPPGASPETFRVRAQAWMLGTIVVTHNRLTPIEMSRSEAKIRQDGRDSYIFFLLCSGAIRGTTDDREFTLGPGQVAVFDLSRTYEIEGEDSESISVAVGRAALHDALRRDPYLHGTILDGTPGALLIDHIAALTRHLPQATLHQVPALQQATLAQLVAGISSTASEEQESDEGVLHLRHLARRYIDRHLIDRDLTPDRLADVLSVPRATLYRSFKSLGGVAAYIQRRRLEAVRTLLLHRDESREIGELAQTFGFSSVPHFTTAFRRAYGTTPSAMRAKRTLPLDLRSDDPEAAEPERFRRWRKRSDES